MLRIGVALLGARITLAQIGQLGIGPLATAALGIVSTIALGATLWLAAIFVVYLCAFRQ